MRRRTAAQLLVCVLTKALTPPSLVRRRRAPIVYSDEPPLPPEPAGDALPEPAADEFDDLSDLLDDEDDDLLALDDEATPPPPADDDDDDDGLAELLRMGDAGDSAASLEEEWQRRRAEMEDKAEKNAARAEKRRLQAEAEEAFARERGLGLLHTDPVCRGVVVCVTRGTSEDNATVVELTDALRAEHGMRVEVAHNVDPDPEEDLPLFEVWLEGYRYQLLHARNWRGDGDLTAEKIQALVSAVGEEISDEAELVLGTYPDVED
jgi:hypothetical protein